MTNYKFEEAKSPLPDWARIEIRREVASSIGILVKNLDRLLDYLKKENELGNYVEIDFPILNFRITYKLSLYYKRPIVSVFGWRNPEIFLGNIIIDNYDCLDENEIKYLGDWQKYDDTIKRFLI